MTQLPEQVSGEECMNCRDLGAVNGQDVNPRGDIPSAALLQDVAADSELPVGPGRAVLPALRADVLADELPEWLPSGG